MPWGSVRLVPGVNTERTPTLNEAGISVSSLIRYKDDLVQKYGGWTSYLSFAVTPVPRDLHGWQDLNGVSHLGIGATKGLQVITSGTLVDITPQTLTSDFAPNFSATSGTAVISVTDPNIANVTTFDSVYLAVPVSVGGTVLSGVFPIITITGASSYTINAKTAASFTETNPTVTNASTNIGSTILHFASVGTWVATNMVAADITHTNALVLGSLVSATTATTVTLSTAVISTVSNGDSIVFCSIPVYTTGNNSAVVTVILQNHGLSVGNQVFLSPSTTNSGVTIQGNYTVLAVIDANNFQISVGNQANATTTFAMNSGQAEIVYYLNLGPSLPGQGYGLGNYGAGNYGFGTAGGSAQTGTPIIASDWTQDNWGEILLACPSGGGVYAYDPTAGFSNAGLVATAPPFNGGIFVSNSQQILVCWASTAKDSIGIVQDPMLVRWSDVGDYTVFTALTTNQAGSFRIPIGSEIRGGMATPSQNLIWTDLDCWAMNYQGPPFVFGFNKIGAGAGLISSHAVQSLRGGVYWMGNKNFYAYTGSGLNVIPCPVWDAIFQNLNQSFTANIRAMPNTPFNEVGWLYPSSASVSGECDSYVKFNITEPGQPWDYGPMRRSAWMDQTALGMPIGAQSNGFVYQHETTNDAAGQAIIASFQTGYFMIADGEEFAFVDMIVPDMKWGFFPGSGSANIQMSFSVIDFPGDTPDVFGPYTVTQATEFISVRLRGRQMAITAQSSDLGSFWRLGRIRYRFAPSGRR